MARKIGVVGLGIMGAPMAGHLTRAGFDVIGYTRSTSGARRLAEAGGRSAASLAELAREAETVLLMLPDSPDVQEVALGENGIIANLATGALLIDCSTISPRVAIEVADAAREAGIDAVDAPVSGGEGGARSGALSIMVGGPASSFERARPILDVFSATLQHVGGSGAGQTVKAANQLLVAGQLALVAEALTLLQANDVDIDASLAVLGGGLASSRVLEVKAPLMLAQDFEPGFRIDLHCKDLGIVLDVAKQSSVDLTVTPLVDTMFRAARDGGLADRDHSAIIVPMMAAASERTQ